ncbi:XrtA/PEP-CTERM system-associated ATPase [uncultured Parasphingopyxis sp.]|uniref:XrtA/PEP-CTERM system-associated ATPase n=1 Tax=uncultured Parasphingopyxis sp. TaxID=1547918 RepID=UPI0026283191|nr:XrtA/PEP-CTERM system-associated ATPase [uncultured Parasphingopyxis sp.]
MYSDHYGLNGNPFQLTPDPRFWFESETHRKAMAYLGYGLAQGEGFIVITGDIGAGKTTLVGHLMATIDSARLTAVQIVSTQVEGDDMLRLVAQQLGIDSNGAEKAQLLDRIERFLHGQAREGKRTLLIVDEAQNLGISALEELRMLSNFQSGGRALLQIFLLGQPEFRERIKSAPNLEQLRQRVIATHHLEPMQAKEIESYVVHRLSIAGWQGNPQFTADAYTALYVATGGVPRRLNTLMARVLLFGAVEERTTIDGAAVQAVLDDLAGEEPREANEHAAEASQPEPEPELEQEDEFADDPVLERPDEFASLAPQQPVHDPIAPDNEPVVFETEEPETEQHSDHEVRQDDRLAAIEARLEEQDAALRRVLTLLVDWVEEEEARPQFGVVRGSAA